MKKIIALILAFVFVGMLVGCDDSASNSTTTTTSTISGNPSDSDNPNAPTTPPDDDTDLGPDDSNDDYQGPANPNYNMPTVEETLGNAMNIFTDKDTFGNEGTISGYTTYSAQINMANYTGGKKCKIETSGIYRVYGTTPNGQLEIKAKGQNVIVVLDNANITYLGSAPAIYSEDCASVTIVLAENSINRIQDSSVNTENGAIKVKNCNLTLNGKGKLVVTANGNRAHGIANSKQLTIKGGTYEIETKCHGIYGKEGLTINGGKFKINAARSGFKSGNDGNGTEADIQVGKIVINSCSANIKTHTNGLNAYGSIEINNGRIEVNASGKGIVATQNIGINGGILVLSTKEDTIKSDANVTIGGSANIKITTNGNGIECVNGTVSTTGTIYIKTIPVFVEDKENGEYKYSNGQYVLLDGTEGASVKKYSLIECKGFEVREKLTVSNGTIGINSYEDGMNGTTVELSGGNVVVSTQKDAIDASNTDDTVGTLKVTGKANINVLQSDKGLKAAKSVSLEGGNTLIASLTDAIKSKEVVVLLGTHILLEKVDCSKYSFTIKGGQFISIGTTEKPMGYQATISNAKGDITNKNLCLAGQSITITMGTISKTVILPKDYVEKMCVVVCDTVGGLCSVVIGDNLKTETLISGEIIS